MTKTIWVSRKMKKMTFLYSKKEVVHLFLFTPCILSLCPPFLKSKPQNMNKLRFTAIVYASLIFVLNSCNSNESTDATTADSTTSIGNDTTSTTNTASTIVNTPQNLMVATHRVANFSKWKTSYDANDSLRLAFGVHSYVVGRGIEDSNMVLVALKVDDLDKAKAFAKDRSLKQAMQKGGVVGTPDIKFTTMVFQDTGVISTDLRSRTTFTVKDFESWKQSFESRKQSRIDNGIVERAFGYDADDNKKVTLVVAINDSANAQAYWKSDLLKQIRAESGVTSEPKRFIYRMVQRY